MNGTVTLAAWPRRARIRWIAGLSVVIVTVATTLSACDEAEHPAQTASSEQSMTEPVAIADMPGAPETFTLANGMQVLVIPDHRVPVVTHMVWYRIGAADEEPGKSGLAHFLEHLMFKGTKKVGPGQLSRIVARNGGRDNAFTSSDYTAYYQRVALDRLPLVMEMEADRMANLTLTDTEVLPERDVVLEERRMRVDNEPSQILAERMTRALYGDAGYGIPVIGWAEEVAKLTTQDALGFYHRYYAPNDAILIVAGDITAAELKPLAEKYYGPLVPSENLPARIRNSVTEPGEPIRIELKDARVEQPHLQRSYLAPSYTTASSDEAIALDVLSELLGGGTTSRLYKALVIDKRLAASAGSWYTGSALGEGRFDIYALPRLGVDLGEIEDALDREIAKLKTGLVSAEELTRAKTLLVADAIYARDRQEEMARIYGVTLTTGGKPEDVIAWPDRIKSVTAESVREAARKYLEKQRSVTGLLLPEDGA